MRGKIYSESEVILHEHPDRIGFVDKTGEKIGRLTVIGYAGRSETRIAMWFCQCECGNFTKVHKRSLEAGYTKSCGCLHTENQKAIATHGQTRNYTATPEYRSWSSMLDRVKNPKNNSFLDYGGRGIKVCDRWLNFDNFLADMGNRPDGTSIDRKDVNGNYAPGNCRWATMEEQNNNKRNNRHITYAGKTQNYAQWERELGLNKGSLCARLKKGHTFEEAISKSFRVKNHTITYNGRTQTIAEWQKELGFKSDTILSRMRIGWPIEKIMTTPNKEKKTKVPKKRKIVDIVIEMSDIGSSLIEISKVIDRDVRYVSSVLRYIKKSRQ